MSLENTFDINADAPLNITNLLGNNDLLRLTSANRMFKNWGYVDGLSLRKNTQKEMVKQSLAKERIHLEYNPLAQYPLFPDPLYGPDYTPPAPTEKQMTNRNKMIGAMGGMRTIFPRGEDEYRGFMGRVPLKFTYPHSGDVRGGDDQPSDDDEKTYRIE